MSQNIYWTEELSVGVEEIDTQHRELFDRANSLITACTSDAAGEEIYSLLGFLHSYVREHFTAEEALMNRAGYPEEELHRRQHLNFCRRLTELEKSFTAESGALKILGQVNELIVDWLYEHICMEDRKLGTFLQQSGHP